MRTAPALLALLLTSALAWAAEPMPEDLNLARKYIAAEEAATKAEIDRLRGEVSKLNQELRATSTRQSDNPVQKRDVLKKVRDKLDAARARLRRLERGEEKAIPSIALNALEIGSIGRVAPPLGHYGGFWVTRTNYMLVMEVSGAIYVRQVVDERNMLVQGVAPKIGSPKAQESTALIWVADFATAGLTDDSQIDFGDRIFAVKGTQQYGNAGGSTTTVFVLTPFDLPAARAALDAATSEEAK